MEEKTSGSNVAAEQPVSQQTTTTSPSAEVAGTEHRQAYGTAKTENLRDSGLWRFILPALIIIFCLTLLAVPLIILAELLRNTIQAIASDNAAEAQLLWVWITMIVVEVAVAIVIIWGLCKAFLTQAGNYHS
jgi:ABC-type sulfate transport system permease subunit